HIPIGTRAGLKVFDGWNLSLLKEARENPSESLNKAGPLQGSSKIDQPINRSTDQHPSPAKRASNSDSVVAVRSVSSSLLLCKPGT
ncbi:TPA: hypothetical protein ACF6OI_004891, partial [Escherichia coli]